MVLRIEHNPDAFINALQNSTINLTADGHWYTECCLVRVFRWLFSSWENRRLLNITEIFNNVILKGLERDPVLIGKDGIQNKVLLAKVGNIGDVIEAKLSTRTKEKDIRIALRELKRNIVAFEYRSELLMPIEGDVKVSEALLKQASDWKRAQIWSRQIPDLSPLDLKLLTQVSRYPKFINLIQNDRELRVRFFKWALRDHNTVQGFIEFPDVVRRICDSLAASRFGYYAGAGLQVQIRDFNGHQKGLKEKVFTMNYENQAGETAAVSILEENTRITLRNGFHITIREIFKQFSKKNNQWGKVEVCGGRITNWNSGRLSRMNAAGYEERIDLKEAEYWKQLPPGRFLSLEAAQSLSKEVDGKKWIVRAMGTRIQEGLGIFGNHAYLYVGIPHEQDGKTGYMFHPMSRFPDKFPGGEVESDYSLVREMETAKESVRIATETRYADIASPDGCVFNLARQHGGTVDVVEPEVGRKIMENVRDHIFRARNQSNFYNVFGPNCAEFTVECFTGTPLADKYHNLFETRFENSQPEGCLGWMFRQILKLPRKWQHTCFRVIFYLAGGSRTLEIREDPYNSHNPRLRQVGLLVNPPWLNRYRVPAAATDLFERNAAPGLHAPCCTHDALEPHALRRLTLSHHAVKDDRSSPAEPHVPQATVTPNPV